MNLQLEYRHMNVSHLAIDEVEHELLIRNMLFHFDDHESVKRRKLKDRMKEERGLGINSVAFARTWRSAKEEITMVNSRMNAIAGIFDNPKADIRQKQKMRTRVIHYRVRIAHLARALDARKYLPKITEIENQIDRIIDIHFPLLPNQADKKKEQKPIEKKITEALDEVRNEIATLNDTVANLDGDDEGGDNDQASGGAKPNSNEQNNKEMELSMKRTDAILDKLNEYEEGKEEDFDLLIKAFKDFVVQTSDQQRNKREQEMKLEEDRRKEMELMIERKQNLEKLLAELNEKVKKEQAEKAAALLAKDNQHESESDETSSSESEKESPPKPINTKPIKKSEKSKRKNRKGQKIKINKNNKKQLSSDSSEEPSSPDSSESTESSSVSSEFQSSDSSSDSSEVDRKRRRRSNKKKSRKSRNSRKPMKRIPVAEWRLKYDGKDDGRKVAEFLKEVKMRCRSEDVSDYELFRSAIHLFTGRAKEWYIDGVDNGDFGNWSELKKELKREFLPPDIDFQLEIQATNRRQVRGEKFADYFHEIQKLFQSMTKQLSDKRKFNIIWRNMRHDYKNALTGAGIKSLSKLRTYGRRIDENFSFVQKQSEFTNRSRNNQVSEITSDQNKNPKNSGSSGNNSRIFTNSKFNPAKPNASGEQKGDQKGKAGNDKGKKEEGKTEPMEGSVKGTMQALVNKYQRPSIGTCYNCRKHGHHYVECPELRRKFCRLCGFSDVYTSACPFCQKNTEGSA